MKNDTCEENVMQIAICDNEQKELLKPFSQEQFDEVQKKYMEFCRKEVTK